MWRLTFHSGLNMPIWAEGRVLTFWNISYLVEMFKVKHNIAPTPIQNLFPVYENVFNLRSERCWQSSNVRTVGFGTETLVYRGQKTWQLLPDLIRNSNTLSEFTGKFKNWKKPIGCTCRLCKTM